MSDFDKSLAFVLKWEGGFVDNPDDPGGATNQGITQKTYDAWRKTQNEPVQPVKNIHADEVTNIYRANYWAAACCDQLEWPVNLCLFDTAVNMGVGQARRLLQQSVLVTIDGDIGADTLKAIQRFDALTTVRRLLTARMTRYGVIVATRPSSAQFMKGWLHRIGGLLQAL